MLKMKKLVTKLPMFVSARYNQNGPEVKYSLESLFDKIEKRSAERINGIKEEMRADIAALREVMKADNAAFIEFMKAENAALRADNAALRADNAAFIEFMKAENAALRADNAAFIEFMKAELASLKDAINSLVYVHGACTAIAVAVIVLIVRYYSVENFFNWQ
uniref:Uncharacterized protein n=1 Tax=Acrobeloides nanus TaxID=290746 RepID=A0A914DIK8_9BILA